MKNTLRNINGILGIKEGKICEPEDTTIENIQNEGQKG